MKTSNDGLLAGKASVASEARLDAAFAAGKADALQGKPKNVKQFIMNSDRQFYLSAYKAHSK